MKKLNTILGTLAVTGSLLAGLPALADTSATTTATVAPPTLADRMILSYFGVYNGPSISNPNEFTSDEGNMESDVQNIDNTFTAGIKINDNLRFLLNHRFTIRPIFLMPDTHVEGAGVPFAYRNKDPWVTLAVPKLLQVGSLKVSAQLRGFFPATTHARMYGAIRLDQNTMFDVPKTRLSLGVYTIQRANMLTDAGAAGNMENFFLDVSPYANYQITPTLAATFWSDVVQATYSTVGSKKLAQGWSNALIPLYFGVGWDITPSVNLNPQLSIYPQNASLEQTAIGAILSAKIL